jgi:hypothetical protein
MATRRRIDHTADGWRLLVARDVDAPAESAWDVFVDTYRWSDWGPTVSDVDCPDRRIREGSTGHVRVAGIWVPFRITFCRDHRWSWRVAGIPATGHRVERLGSSRCRAVFELPLPAAGYAPVCRRALRKVARLATETS